MLEKWKMYIDPDPDPDQSQNVVNCSLSCTSQKFHEN